MNPAVERCTAGIGIWERASNDGGCEPDVVLACAGDVPTIELVEHRHHIAEHGVDMPEIRDRTWPGN